MSCPRPSSRSGTAIRCALAALLLSFISAAASAYTVTVNVRGRSWGSAFVNGSLQTVPTIDFPQTTYSSNLPNPLQVAIDPSNSFGPAGGVYMGVLGNYDTTVAPGGIHMVSRSVGQFDSPGFAPTSQDAFSIFIEGTLEASYADDVTITLAGVPQGTPFLMSALVKLDGNVGTRFSGPASGPIADAYANGFWGLGLAVPGGRPAGVPTTITNQFRDGSGGLVSVHQWGVQFDQFAQYGLLGFKPVTLYGRSGVLSSLDMYLNLQSGAAAGTGGTEAGHADAGVNLAFNHTWSWGGITAVQLLDGTPVALSDVDVQSSSGFDYRNTYVAAVPEPGTAALLAIAALATTRAARRRFDT